MEPGETADQFIVSGRGALHISILMENMRREGYEFAVGPPKARCRRAQPPGPAVPLSANSGNVMEDMRRDGDKVAVGPPKARCHCAKQPGRAFGIGRKRPALDVLPLRDVCSRTQWPHQQGWARLPVVAASRRCHRIEAAPAPDAGRPAAPPAS